MTRLASIVITTVLLLGAIAMGLVATPGCTSPGNGPPLSPARAWVDASRAVHDVIAPRFTIYLELDTTLDPVTRANLERTLTDWDFMIRQAEAAIAPPPAVPPGPPSPAPPAAHPNTGGGL
jgi:hypothetical protein